MPKVVSLPRVKRIPLTRGKAALVDAEDYSRIADRMWQANPCGKKWRAIANFKGKKKYMHHVVLNHTYDGRMVVDHINGNPLDNRKSNLRIVTQQTNMLNTDRHRNQVGYYFHNPSRFWYAMIKEPYKPRKYLGCRKTKEEIIELVTSARNSLL